jgi:hypothetical protein
MTQDEIIAMLRASCDKDKVDPEQNGFWVIHTPDGFWVIHTPELEAFAKLVAQHEREACAEVCKKHADFYAGLEPSPIAQSAWAACIDNRDTILARRRTHEEA